MTSWRATWQAAGVCESEERGKCATWLETGGQLTPWRKVLSVKKTPVSAFLPSDSRDKGYSSSSLSSAHPDPPKQHCWGTCHSKYSPLMEIRHHGDDERKESSNGYNPLFRNWAPATHHRVFTTGRKWREVKPSINKKNCGPAKLFSIFVVSFPLSLHNLYDTTLQIVLQGHSLNHGTRGDDSFSSWHM